MGIVFWYVESGKILYCFDVWLEWDDWEIVQLMISFVYNVGVVVGSEQ